MTVYIKVKKKFGITERDQSIRYFEPGIYEVPDELAKIEFVKAHSSRIASPDDRLKEPVVVPPTTPPRRQISAPLPPIPKVEGTLAPLSPDNSAIMAANEAARAKAAEATVTPGPITRLTGAQAVMREGMTAVPSDAESEAEPEKRGPGRPKKTA